MYNKYNDLLNFDGQFNQQINTELNIVNNAAELYYFL